MFQVLQMLHTNVPNLPDFPYVPNVLYIPNNPYVPMSQMIELSQFSQMSLKKFTNDVQICITVTCHSCSSLKLWQLEGVEGSVAPGLQQVQLVVRLIDV